MSNKLIQQHLKNTVRLLNDPELIKVLNIFENNSYKKLEKTTRIVSYKWYFSHLIPSISYSFPL